MNEESETAGKTASVVSEKDMTAGMLLRKAREASGLHVAALAVSMKVPVKKLEALESDRLDDLPDAVFVRALAASMCRALKVDPAPILSKLPLSSAPVLDRDERGINMPFQSPGMFHGSPVAALVSKPSMMIVLVLLVAALVVIFFPETQSSSRTDVAGDKAPAVNAVAETPPTEKPIASAEPVDATKPAQASSPAVSASDIAKVAVVAAPLAGSANGPEVVRFIATSSAWVRVSDSKGSVQFEKTLAAGETGGASGELPLSVVVGNVGATTVEVRGQPFALDAIAKNNVARFEVK